MNVWPDFSIETWALIVVAFTFITIYGYPPYGFFKKLGIHGPTPLPFVGTFLGYLQDIHNYDKKCYQMYGKVWGLYDGRQPVLAVMDTSMIKTILVKECYSVFTNRRDFGFNGSLHDATSVVEDEEWKRIRSVLSPSFTSDQLKEVFWTILLYKTSGSQPTYESLVQMEYLDLVLNESMKLYPVASHLERMAKTSVEVNGPEVFKADRFRKENKDNIDPYAFLPFGAGPRNCIGMRFAILMMKLAIVEILQNFSFVTCKETINQVDFVQLMVDTQIEEGAAQDKSSLKGLPAHEILSQAMIFIFAGYETSNSSLYFLAYNLATNPDIQKTLQEEIDETFPEKSQPTYESLVQMEYLDLVLNESMKLYPVASHLERMAKTSVEVNGVTIPKGTVMIPVYPLYYDPMLWPQPEVFKADRFRKENKDNIDPYAFLPFGAGPRNCIGMRFAILMMKLAIVEILQNFSFVTCKETIVPLLLITDGFTTPQHPIKLKLKPRSTPTECPS
ncbi:cytochrome P450 3A30-like [Thalassophryne amazonica]|uniref:cytochrome P450 3A30-like n=1 Tax=Thalassophryne amazonica TaxID=390379 RepID=UPI001471DFA8|nr:cytochrome P450 3A30-like [Thalassophryne amazonica]